MDEILPRLIILFSLRYNNILNHARFAGDNGDDPKNPSTPSEDGKGNATANNSTLAPKPDNSTIDEGSDVQPIDSVITNGLSRTVLSQIYPSPSSILDTSLARFNTII